MDLATRSVRRLLDFNEATLDRAVPKGTGKLDPFTQPWVPSLEAGWDDIRAEVDQLVEQGVALPATGDIAGFDQGNEGEWTSFILHSYGTWLDFNIARCPRTTELVRSIPGMQVAGFSVLGPHSHLPRHRGFNRGALRYQMGMRVPEPEGSCRIRVGEDMHVWADRAHLLFDHSVEHEAWNDSDAPRYVLFVEFVWDLPGFPGRLNRFTQGVFAKGARGLPDRAREFEAALNG